MIHLDVHSNHSFLDGTARFDQIVGRAVSYGMSSLAITDTDGLYGAIPFYKTARNAGIKPIIGVSIKNVVLLARDREGYSRLCRLVSEYHLSDDFDLASHTISKHIFVLTSDRLLIRQLYVRGVRPLVAITNWGSRRSRYEAGKMFDFARSMKLKPVAVNPVYFLDAEQFRIHCVLSAIRINKTIDNLSADDVAPENARFHSPQEMRQLYQDWPETLANTEWVAERCNVKLELGTPIFPECTLPRKETPFSHLWKLTFDGIKKLYKPLTPPVIKRLEYELDIINRLGFAPYFIIVWDIVCFAREHGIPIVGRGSAANSIVAYALGITRVDPIKYDLLFERFLNLARTDCPDIDLDICWRRRDRVIDYAYDKYGADRVAMICTLNTFRARSAIREVAKAFGLLDSEISDLTRGIPHYSTHDVRTITKFLPECHAVKVEEEPLKSILEVSEFIDGFPRHLSIHAGGLVIAPRSLTNFLPIQRSTKGILITQYDMGPVEELGLVKIDLLGHRSLTVIDETIQMVRENRGIDLDIEKLPDPDVLTAGLLRQGRTIGCFQIESPAVRALMQHIMADNTDMVIKALSLVRPGTSNCGMKKRFIARRMGREKTVYLHPLLEKVLVDTYGIMLYQEDTIKVAQVIANISPTEAETLRRALSKKRSPEDLAVSMKVFLDKAVRNGVDERTAEQIWGQIDNFAEYSFCKAHACTYGELAYQCAYLKAHFPAEFLSCVLSNRGGFYYPAAYLEEAKRFGIEVLPPDVNRSCFGYTVEDDAIRVGFVEIRDITHGSIKAIQEARKSAPIKGVRDLWIRTGMPVADIETLVHSGAFDGTGWPRPALLWELESIKLKARKAINAGYRDELFLVEPSQGTLVPRLPDYCRRSRRDLEWKAIGMLTSTHPIEYSLPLLLERGLVLSTNMPSYAGRNVSMIGWMIAERRVGLKNRGCMKFLTFEDPEGVFESVVFPKAYQRYGHLLTSHGPYLIYGKIQEDDNYYSIIVEEIQRIGDVFKSSGISSITPPMRWLMKGIRNDAIVHAD